MRTVSFLFLFLVLSFSPPLHGQQARIQGSGKGYAGTELKISRLSDPVTEARIPLMRLTCDSSGVFSFLMPVRGSETVFIESGIYCFYLIVLEGNDYNLKLLDFKAKTEEDIQNPYFIETRVIPEVTSNPSDINNLIRQFDSEFDPIFNRVTDRVFYNVKRNEIPSLIESLNSFSRLDTSDFYGSFVQYRLIMLNMVARGEYHGRLEDSVIINSTFAYDNTAYLDLVRQAYSGLFTMLAAGPAGIKIQKAVSSRSVEELKKTIGDNSRVSNDNLKEYIILINLHSAFYNRTIKPPDILWFLDALSSGSSSSFIRTVTGAIGGRLKSAAEGTPAPGFSLPDNSGKKVTLGSFAGKYLLLSFASADNTFSISEYGILKNWYGKYSDSLAVVTILRDWDFPRAVARMKSFGFGWIFVDGFNADLLEFDYDVKLYPSFILIDRTGRVLVKNCPFPSENLESYLKSVVFQGGK